eukprot:1497633-Amphidinium_carterae.1
MLEWRFCRERFTTSKTRRYLVYNINSRKLTGVYRNACTGGKEHSAKEENTTRGKKANQEDYFGRVLLVSSQHPVQQW